MPLFSADVTRVANTRIFARPTGQATQYLVYQIEYESQNDLALIIPIPTPPGTASDAVRFIDLSGYPVFFANLASGFPVARGGVVNASAHTPAQQVGSFGASFLPSLADFSQLDTRYRISDEMWKQLPEYNDYGFAVFILRADAQMTHPIALEFPVRNPNLLYFPTVNLHASTFEQDSYFDHDLFCQAHVDWLRSYDVAQSFMDIDRAQGILDPNQRVERFTVLGLHPNSDIVLTLDH
ncbi:MAG TPA: hypothetical protein VFD70_08265 [Anaerolineae bacterium]|nr:hypothetical protein [Anaerolineae bacterium]